MSTTYQRGSAHALLTLSTIVIRNHPHDPVWETHSGGATPPVTQRKEVGPMNDQPKVRFIQDGPVATVTLDSPPRNQIGARMIADLIAAISQAESADGVRALVLCGAGEMFSAGADVALFAGMSASQVRPLIGSFIELGHRIERLPYPTLAAVHGICMAGGFELVLYCDLLWAAAGTQMGLPETRLGIVPLAGVSNASQPAQASAGRERSHWVQTCTPQSSSPNGVWSTRWCLLTNWQPPRRITRAVSPLAPPAPTRSSSSWDGRT